MTPASRRTFLTGAGLLALVAALATPALAKSAPDVPWTMASAFQPALPVIYGGATHNLRRRRGCSDEYLWWKSPNIRSTIS